MGSGGLLSLYMRLAGLLSSKKRPGSRTGVVWTCPIFWPTGYLQEMPRFMTDRFLSPKLRGLPG